MLLFLLVIRVYFFREIMQRITPHIVVSLLAIEFLLIF